MPADTCSCTLQNWLFSLTEQMHTKMTVDKLRQLSDIERLNLWSLGDFEDEELTIISDNMPSLQQLKVSMSLPIADSFYLEQAADTMQCKLLTVSLYMYRLSRRYQSSSKLTSLSQHVYGSLGCKATCQFMQNLHLMRRIKQSLRYYTCFCKSRAKLLEHANREKTCNSQCSVCAGQAECTGHRSGYRSSR